MLSLTNEMSSSSRNSNFVRIIRQTDQACTNCCCGTPYVTSIQYIRFSASLKISYKATPCVIWANLHTSVDTLQYCVSTYSARRLHSVLQQSMYKTILYLRSGLDWTQIGWKWHKQTSKASQIEMCMQWTVMVALLEQQVVHWACHCCYTDSYTSWSAN